ncbi:MAG: sulfotransferase [Flavobacteriales bacterium]|nr:sulfotransferase [Flavobacteriales bacterium]
MPIEPLLTRGQRFMERRWLAFRLARLQRYMKTDPSRAILLFASPRGGSTWMEEMLATIPRTATIWEPLDLDRGTGFRELGFGWRQHIPEETRWPEAEELFTCLFSGKLLSPYLAQATTPAELRAADRLIVKFVRGHLLLPWLVKRFSMPKPVLLVRHPCAVVASMMKHGAWDEHPIPPPLPAAHRYDELVMHYHNIAGTIRTKEEYLAHIWCSTHAYLLKHPLNDKAWTTITYEELLLDTEGTLKKVFAPWGMPVPQAALELSKHPSRTTRPGSPTAQPLDQLTHWRSLLDQGQQDRILGMVERFDVDLYGTDPLPVRRFTHGER